MTLIRKLTLQNGFHMYLSTCFSFVLKAFCASFSPLSGMPNSNFSPILRLQPWGHLAASSVSDTLEASDILSCTPSLPALQVPLPLTSFLVPCRNQILLRKAAYIRKFVWVKLDERISLKEIPGLRN